MSEQRMTEYPSIDKPWLKYYPQEAINAPLPEYTIYEYLWENNKNHPNDIALIYINRKVTYAELFRNIENCQRALLATGVKEKDIVTVALPSIPEAIYLVYAINKIGAIANMIHPLAGENEIRDYLNEVGSSVCLMFTGTYDIMKNVLEQTSVKTAVVISAAESLPFGIKQLYRLKAKEAPLPKGETVISWSNFLHKGRGTVLHTARKNIDETAIISHTGGTTGVPKGVMCSDRSINTVIWEIGLMLSHQRQDRLLVVLPPFVNYSLVNGMLEPLAFGFQTILIPDYKPELFAKYIKKYHPNHMNTIPAYLEAWLNISELKTMDLSCLCHIFYGGEAMDVQKEDEVNALILSRGAQHKIGKGLGSTEMVSAATAAVTQECNLPGSAGIPLVKVNCKIVDPDTGEECTYHQIGEICFSGPQLMLGYYHHQEATDKIIKIHDDGIRWLHTGDLGYLNEDGILFVSGRMKRIIMTKGKDGAVTKMFPDRIEKLVMQHPSVRLCCVVGISDNDRINYAKAVLVLHEEHVGMNRIAEEILALCKQQLPEYMIPDRFEFLPDLPRTERGKIDYRALEEKGQ